MLSGQMKHLSLLLGLMKHNMSPQERIEFEQMKATLESLRQVLDVPFIESMKLRLNDSYPALDVSTKTSASATQAVNEGGASTYSVMYPPTGFIQIDGKNIPYIS